MSSDTSFKTILSPAELTSKDRSKEPEIIPPLKNFQLLISDIVAKEKFSSVFIGCSDLDYFGYISQTIGWGGTYHCFQSLYSSLLKIPHIKEHFGKVWMDTVPSIFAIQLKLEEAWKAGFDSEGAAYFEGRVFNTTKKIGCTEIWTLFHYLQISCRIVDFPVDPTKSIDWITSYYTKEFERVLAVSLSASTLSSSNELVVGAKDGNPSTYISPVYLQGVGKSYIAFAMEGDIASKNVLIFDADLYERIPGLGSAASDAKTAVPPLRVGKDTIGPVVGAQCQVLYIDSLEIVPVEKRDEVREIPSVEGDAPADDGGGGVSSGGDDARADGGGASSSSSSGDGDGEKK